MWFLFGSLSPANLAELIQFQSFTSGPPENIIAADLEHKFPNSVNCETYRQYERQEQAGARRAPIVLMPEFGKIPVVKSPVDAKVTQKVWNAVHIHYICQFSITFVAFWLKR